MNSKSNELREKLRDILFGASGGISDMANVEIDQIFSIIQQTALEARLDEAERALNDYNTLEEYRHNPSMELKPGNLKLLDRIATLQSQIKKEQT